MSVTTHEIERDEAAEAAEVRRQGRGRLTRVGDVNVLHVAGSDYEMGFQHGRLLAEEIARGPIPYYRQVVEKMMGSSLGPLSKIAWPTLQRTLGRRVARGLPAYVEETVRGLADGAGLDHQSFLDGCTMPDAMMWITARVMQLEGHGPAVAHRLALELGCTSAVAWGDATTDGALLHARNFDYHGVGCWPSTKTVLFHEPDHGQRYVSVTAAGVALGGITAMNEAGLSLTVHQHMFTDRTRLGGTPIGIVGDLVMREATDLDEAQRILESHRPIGCWTYVITDGPRREVLCFEENPDRRVAHRHDADDGTFGYANVYLDEELGASEVMLYGSYWRHNEGRHRRANELLEERRGTLDPQGMASILGDTGSTDCRVRDSIAMVMTVGSVVFRPEDGTVWVGTGEAPTSRGTYLPFSFEAGGHDPARGELRVGALEDEDARDAFERFRQAYLAYVDDDDVHAARARMDEARGLAPEQPLYHSLAGILALAAGDAAGAAEALSAALELGHPDAERVASFHLWRGRAHDVLGRRDDAVKDYRWALGHYADPPVHAAAKRGLRRRFTARRARRIHPDVGLADVVMP
ncbi:MAG TPA: C45 family peptidase [Sandaracinaceae bacterium LLY-WYZ-13_1]|nr:C45 family peptidase [Sandaracinaceae bacterium LLY-WYZ-13_1]